MGFFARKKQSLGGLFNVEFILNLFVYHFMSCSSPAHLLFISRSCKWGAQVVHHFIKVIKGGPTCAYNWLYCLVAFRSKMALCLDFQHGNHRSHLKTYQAEESVRKQPYLHAMRKANVELLSLPLTM